MRPGPVALAQGDGTASRPVTNAALTIDPASSATRTRALGRGGSTGGGGGVGRAGGGVGRTAAAALGAGPGRGGAGAGRRMTLFTQRIGGTYGRRRGPVPKPPGGRVSGPM